LLARAYEFASEKHAGVKRRTGEPYIEHPIAVAGIWPNSAWTTPLLPPGCCMTCRKIAASRSRR
jgi:GTP pyrophosphokinase